MHVASPHVTDTTTTATATTTTAVAAPPPPPDYCDLFMQLALEEAAVALREREVPVGAVLVSLGLNHYASSSSTPPFLTRSRAEDCVQRDGREVQREDGTNDDTGGTGVGVGGVSADQQLQALLTSYARHPSQEDLHGVGLVARGRNATNRLKHALAHAEFLATEQLLLSATHAKGRGRHKPTSSSGDENERDEGAVGVGPPDLSSYVLYVTVEPCILCAAFLRYNRIAHVFFGAGNDRFGGNGSVLAIHNAQQEPQRTAAARGGADYSSEGGHRAEEAVALLRRFYMGENPNAPGDRRKRKRRD